MAKKKSILEYEKFLPVRVKQEHINLFRKAAENDGRTLSGWVRDRLQKAANRELKK